MDLQNNAQPDSQTMEKIVARFFLKCLHIILCSRIPSVHQHDRSGELTPSTSRERKSDKWFSLILGDRPTALDNLKFWQRNLTDPMIIDIIAVDRSSVETVIERWVVQYEPVRLLAAQVGEYAGSCKKTYKRTIVLLRSIYSTMRLLPAHMIFQLLSSSSHAYDFDIIYKFSSFSDPFSREEDELMTEYNFVPVEALPRRLCVSVTYRSNLSGFNDTPVTSLPTKIIADYVDSPATEPSRAFPSPETGCHATSFPSRGMQPPSAPSHRPHSWTSGLHKAAPFGRSHSLGSSPPFMHFDCPSPSPDIYVPRVPYYRPPAYQNFTAFDEYQLSPPFSHSPSPSPPSYLFNGSPARTHLHSGTAPVSIPFPMIGKSSKHLSPNYPDSNRHYLPPFSPKSVKHDPSSPHSSSGNRSFRKTEASKAGESSSGAASHCSFVKAFRDSKDDSGRFSGLLSSSGSPRIGFSRSSSRLSFQDDLDDGDFSCPFVVDDVDPPGFQSSQDEGAKSGDAAVGALVHLLRAAPPLRQDPGYCSVQPSKARGNGEGGLVSGFGVPRRAAEALEELRGFREMKDLLLSGGEKHSLV